MNSPLAVVERRRRQFRPAIAGFVLAWLTACTTVPMDRQSVRHDTLAARSTLQPLQCGHRLAAVIDKRADGNAAGSIGRHAFSLGEATQLVRERLAMFGFDEDPSLPGVTVEIHQLYLAQNLTTKIPVAVYRVTVNDETPHVLRSRAASMNWNSTDDEGFRALARALDDVDAQMIALLNARCTSKPRH